MTFTLRVVAARSIPSVGKTVVSAELVEGAIVPPAEAVGRVAGRDVSIIVRSVALEGRRAIADVADRTVTLEVDAPGVSPDALIGVVFSSRNR
jgi:hypothetical protein